jgi:lipoyl(octanoyl) transferase
MLPLRGATRCGTLVLVILVVAGHVLQDCQAWMTPTMTPTTTTMTSWISDSTAPRRTTASRTKQTTTVSCRMVAPQQLGTFEPLTLSTLSSSSSSSSASSSAAVLLDVQEEVIQQEDRFVILEDLVSAAPSTQSPGTASNGGINSDLWIPRMQQQQQQQSRLVPFHQGWDIQKELSLEHRHRLDRLRLHPSTGPTTTAAAATTTTRETSFSPFLDKNTATKWQELQQQQQEQCSVAMPQPERDIFRGGLDTILFVQHEPVYTLGSGSDESLILNNHPSDNNNNNNNNHVDDDEHKIPIVRMNRGGEVTYHGPGMLVVYPVLDLRNYRKDIHWYMRALEEAVLLALQDVGIQGAVRDEETTGVWIRSNDQDDNGELYKVAAIGIHCRQWITQHGLAINVEKNPISERAFAGIVPCGLHGRKVGCVNQFLDEKHAITVEQMATSMVASLEEVFRIKLVKRPL